MRRSRPKPVGSSMSPPGFEGGADRTPYGNITARTLIVAGDRDRLRLPGFADELAARIPDARAAVLANAGHCPNIERADEVGKLIIEFLTADT